MGNPETGDVGTLLQSWSAGDRTALDELMPLVYRELRRLAAAYLRRERPGHTLQTTALVHEAYLRLVAQPQGNRDHRAHFFGIAANLMRQILVNHAERRRAAKRGSGAHLALQDIAEPAQPELDLVELDLALRKLARLDPRQGRIVELRFFGGLSEDEIAEVVGISVSTVQREWRTARAALYRELRQSGAN